ncbi:hypothetical protein EV193_103436 [Herbihabitans rhizosphaerae]|uniref:Guanylate cyclase domain-containing protein n=1 Tax=Herbihabitans rhizosphaerae TaxID=1872711 RepID=A0A4Q7KWR8_9PSEU|nr:hypothetical protein [Herbihabitans rhizosphaerae]RZS41117.1 hypothetical protein EV193_103436 [Herbihabitans rhizosphaerae]
MTERVSVYRALFAIDVERSSARDNAGYARMREALFPAVVEAFEASGIDWKRCETQDRGDELIVLVEPDVPKSRLVYPLLGHLAETLRHRNRTAREDDVIRVRVALHAGDLVRDAHGLTGSPKVVLARMLNAPATKLALAGTPAATVVLVVSDVFHTDVISQGHKGIHPEEFAGTTVAITDSKTVRAWLTVVGHGAPDVRPEPAQSDNAQAVRPEPPAPGGGINFGSGATVKGDVFTGNKTVYGDGRTG